MKKDTVDVKIKPEQNIMKFTTPRVINAKLYRSTLIFILIWVIVLCLLLQSMFVYSCDGLSKN